MIIELNIFCLKEEQIQNQDMGLNAPTNFDECFTKKYFFIDISFFYSRSDRPEYTTVGSNGEEFICDENYETVRNKIVNAKLFKLN